MTSNWRISEIAEMIVVPDALWSKPCPHCGKNGLHYDCEAPRVICHACGFEQRVKK